MQGFWQRNIELSYTLLVTLTVALTLSMIYLASDYRYSTYLVEDRPNCLFTHGEQPYRQINRTWCIEQIDLCANRNNCQIKRNQTNGFQYYLLTQEDKEWNLKLKEEHTPDYPTPEWAYKA